MKLKDKNGKEYEFISLAGQDSLGILKEINKPKVIEPPTGLPWLYEFSNDGENWLEKHLFCVISSDTFPYTSAVITNGKITNSTSYRYIRFSTRQWYFHDGKSECPIPEGVKYMMVCISDSGQVVYRHMPDKNHVLWVWEVNHLYKNTRVIGWRPTGEIENNYVMPGDKDA